MRMVTIRGQAEIIIANHRNGAVGDIRLRFIGEYTRFQNLDDELLANVGVPRPQTFKSKMNTPIGNDSPPPPPMPDGDVPF